MTRERTESEGDARFEASFARWGQRVRRRLVLRSVLSGGAFGLALALVPAVVGWRTRHDVLRVTAPLVGLTGGVAGAVLAARRRWSDTDVALYLDHALATDEAITTALGLRHAPSPAAQLVVANAAEALVRADAASPAGPSGPTRPVLFRRVHAVAPLAAIALVVVARLPLPPPPPVAAIEPGTKRAQLADVPGLDRIAKLASLVARDDAQRKRLDAIARDAEKLRSDLRRGLEQREAQDRLARLHDAIVAERLSLGDGERRAGLESAASRLRENALTRGAGEALGDHDLRALDDEMERVANQREADDRKLAQRTLEDAARAAANAGAPDVGRALAEDAKTLAQRGARAELLRELANALDGAGLANDEQHAAAEALDRRGSDEAARKLADALATALEKLTPEERERLAERLKKNLEGGAARGDPGALKDLAKELATADGQAELEARLRKLASEELESDEARREQALDDAREGAGDAERGLGGGATPLPMAGQGAGARGAGGAGDKASGGGENTGGAGENGGGGKGPGGQGGSHGGRTAEAAGESLRARARGPMNRAPGMPGAVTAYSPGKAGGTANTRGTGDLRTAGPAEIDGVERSDVPTEYREQVRQYFQP